MKVRGVLAAVLLAAAAVAAWYGLSRPSPPVIPDLPGSVVPDRAPDPTPDPPPLRPTRDPVPPPNRPARTSSRRPTPTAAAKTATSTRRWKIPPRTSCSTRSSP